MSESTAGEFERFMHQQAQQAINLGHKYFNVDLDGSKESIRSLDRIIDELRERDISNSNLFHDAVYAFGAYFGEVIRRHHPGVLWLKDVPSVGENVMALSLDGVRDCIFPLGMCKKRLESENEDRLWSKYDMIFANPMIPLPMESSQAMPPPLPSKPPPIPPN